MNLPTYLIIVIIMAMKLGTLKKNYSVVCGGNVKRVVIRILYGLPTMPSRRKSNLSRKSRSALRAQLARSQESEESRGGRLSQALARQAASLSAETASQRESRLRFQHCPGRAERDHIPSGVPELFERFRTTSTRTNTESWSSDHAPSEFVPSEVMQRDPAEGSAAAAKPHRGANPDGVRRRRSRFHPAHPAHPEQLSVPLQAPAVPRERLLRHDDQQVAGADAAHRRRGPAHGLLLARPALRSVLARHQLHAAVRACAHRKHAQYRIQGNIVNMLLILYICSITVNKT